MKNRSFVFLSIFIATSWFLFAISQTDAVEESTKSSCRIDREAEKNVFLDSSGNRIYYNIDQRVLWELANDFCISLDLLVAYNFILVPREPVQYTYIKLPPPPEDLGWFPGRSLPRPNYRPSRLIRLSSNTGDPLGPEHLSQQNDRFLLTHRTQIDPFFISAESPQFAWPISPEYGIVSQLYHRNHHGVDIAVPIGTPTQSMANGWVIRTEQDHHVFGRLIVIDHGNDLMGVYGHLSQIDVQEGQFLWQGEQIALSGNSGRSSAPHLHIEIRDTFRYVDPCTRLSNCPLQAFHGPRPVDPNPTMIASDNEKPLEPKAELGPELLSDPGTTLAVPQPAQGDTTVPAQPPPTSTPIP